MTLSQVAKNIGISRSTLYNKIKDSFEFSTAIGNGRFNFCEKDIVDIIEKLSVKVEDKIIPNTNKTLSIQNRRYLGNKYKLLPFIKNVVESECKNINTVADIFAGTGVVCSLFENKKLILNDTLYSNYISYLAWYGSENIDNDKIANIIEYYNGIDIVEDNYMSINFANTYYNLEDCKKIGFIRQDIEDKFVASIINERERAVLITSLLYAMDKVANTCGHYDAYMKNNANYKPLELYNLKATNGNNENNKFYQLDANILVKNIKADLVYIDPPYNSRQYCDAYHLLENIAEWKKPDVVGVAKKMDRTKLKSDYCTNNATSAFEELINNIDSKYILLSYNNMANKGNDRSNAKIKDEDIFRILKRKGEVKVFSEKYKAFSAGKSSIENNEERLFLCICNQENKKKIKSPLNYTGGKYKLLDQILPLFPKNINNFIDLFSGGCDVGINVNCNKVSFIDNNENLICLLNTFKNLDKDDILNLIKNYIEKYNLSQSNIYGYEKYLCNSSDGLGAFNKDGFLKLRNDFNHSFNVDYGYYIALYVLIVYSFNNQIRFNSKKEFNLPVGKRDFNKKMQEKLMRFCERIKNSDYKFVCKSFDQINIDEINQDTFLYADPPYLISCATYNEQDGWNEKKEKELLQFFDNITNRGIKFALSNVLESKGKENKILKDWLAKNRNKYFINYLNKSYANCNYQTKNKEDKTIEVLITNYKGGQNV